MKIFQIKLDFPPSLYSAWGRSNKKMFANKLASDYKKKVKVLVKELYPDWVPFDKPVCFEAIYFEPNHKTRDLDNLQKIIWDAFTKAKVYKDDSLIKESKTKIEFNDQLKGSVFIKISELI